MESLSCPDGIGYVVPAFGIMVLVGAVVFVVAMIRLHRNLPEAERIGASSAVLRCTGWFMAALGTVAMVGSVFAERISATAILSGALLAVIGVALALIAGGRDLPVFLICTGCAVLLLCWGAYTFLFMPVFLVFLGLIITAVALRR